MADNVQISIRETDPDSSDPLEYQIARLALGPGDILVFSTPRTLSRDAFDRIRKTLQELLGDSRKVLILDAGCELSALTAEDLQERMASAS